MLCAPSVLSVSAVVNLYSPVSLLNLNLYLFFCSSIIVVAFVVSFISSTSLTKKLYDVRASWVTPSVAGDRSPAFTSSS